MTSTKLFLDGRRYDPANCDAETLFRACHKVWSVNPFTPEIIEYKKAGPYVMEVSTGIGMDGETIYGLSVWNYMTQTKASHLSGLHFGTKSLHKRIDQIEQYWDVI